MKIRGYVAVIGWLVASSAFAMSPPWYTLQRQMKSTFGDSPWVKVGELREHSEGRYSIHVKCRDVRVAQGVAFALKPRYTPGGIPVDIVVRGPDGARVRAPIAPERATLRETQLMLRLALWGNHQILGTAIRPMWPGESRVLVETRARVVQFFNDDISDPNGYLHAVAAPMFDELLADGVAAQFFTSLRAR